jgi:ATP-dependent helicase/nuclease subunit A
VSGDWESLRREDATARALAQREFTRPLVIEAGAGTGKTATLVARIVVWCLGPGWERARAALVADRRDEDEARIAARVLGRLVAITFTEAAASEMATRVERALAALERGEAVLGVDGEVLPESGLCAGRAAALRGALDQLVVHTLHAYARRLLDGRPFEAGVHPLLEVDADGRVRDALVREVVAQRMAVAYAGEGDALALGGEGVGPRELEAELVALIEAGVTARDLGPELCGPERIAALLARVAQACAAFPAASLEALARVDGRSKRTRETLDAISLTRARLAQPTNAREQRAGVRELWCAETLARLRDWSKGRFRQGEASALGELAGPSRDAAGALLPGVAQLLAFEPDALERARRVLAPLLASVEDALRARGVSSFHGLLASAAELVERRADVTALLRRGIDQLLVDEFQDTDPLQCALVGALALAGPPAERPGLFIVGDPKQSIYGWRNADLEAYEAFVARALAEGGQRMRLSVNHRSLPAVLHEVERAIAPVMLRDPGVQPAFEPLLASPANARRAGFSDERLAPVEHWIAAPWNAEHGDFERNARISELNELEARALAADLRALHDERGVAWSDVGVLFRSRGDWDVYLSALREAEVPFAVEGDRSYYRRREIIDAAAFVRCVLDRNDQIALVAFLRSACVGVPDAAWIPLWAVDFPERVARLGEDDEPVLAALARDVRGIASELPADVPGLERVRGWEHALIAALAELGALRRSFERDPADLFVEKLRGGLLFEVSEAARFLGAWRVANLDRFFRELARDLSAGTATAEVLRRLASAVSEEEPMEEEPPHEDGADAVQILTLHGAKGLDFGHVYLMQLHKGTGRPPGPRVDAARVDGVLELRLLGLPTPGFDRAEARRLRVAQAERVRLLYVGMTRARERLVVSSSWPGRVGRRGATGDLFEGLLERRRELPAPALLAERARREGRAQVDLAGARFALLGLRDASSERVRRREAAALAEVASDPVAEARAHAQRVAAAEARMARPLGGRASDGEGAEDREERARRRSEGGPRPSRAARGSAEVARLTGIAVHRALERLDLGGPVAAGLEYGLEELAAWLESEGEAEPVRAAARAARALLERLTGGRLVARLEALRDHVVARELPLLLAAGSRDDALGFVAGAIDLVYRDPETREWVIVDYKTDTPPAGVSLQAHAQGYARQGRVYRSALCEGLGLAESPRFELWFLAADRSVALRETPSAPAQLSLTLAPRGE